MANTKYAKSQLVGGEKILAAARIHWIVFLNPALIATFGTLLLVISQDIKSGPEGGGGPDALLMLTGMLCILMAITISIPAFLRWISTELVLTNRRVIAKFGFIRRKTFEIDNRRIEGVNLDQGIIGRILGFGSIAVHGTGGGISPIPGIASPGKFKRALDQQVSEVNDVTAMASA